MLGSAKTGNRSLTPFSVLTTKGSGNDYRIETPSLEGKDPVASIPTGHDVVERAFIFNTDLRGIGEGSRDVGLGQNWESFPDRVFEFAPVFPSGSRRQ